MINHRFSFLQTNNLQPMLVLNAFMALVYFFVIAFMFPHESVLLFSLLIAGEVFHVWQVLTYLHTVWDMSYQPKGDKNFSPTVDIFITTAGEPIDIIRKTAVACKKMTYPHKTIYLLNDGYVAKKDNWQEVEKLAEELDINCLTRITPGGAKAGNINNGLANSVGDFVVIFDADHVPYPNFLSETIPYLADEKVGFVQTPQYYKNNEKNYVTRGAWQQQELFFGAICKGKNFHNAATMCGTNMVIRRQALIDVGGMCEDSIAEDFATGMFMHSRGWKSVFVPKVLARGLAPEDFLSYYKQQYRWARGALDVIFEYKLLTRPGLSFSQRIQYLASASFYLSGIVIVIDALLPVIFFFTGITAITISSMLLALVFLPYILLTLYVIQRSSNYSLSFRSLAFSMGAFMIHLQALWSVIRRKKASFSVTSKRALKGNFLYLATPHLLYVLLVVTGMAVSIISEGVSASFINNTAWALLNVAIFTPFIIAASPVGIRKKYPPAKVVKTALTRKAYATVEIDN